MFYYVRGESANKFKIPKSKAQDKFDALVKSLKTSFFVIPAEAGIQCFQKLMTDLDPGFRRGDDFYGTVKFECSKFRLNLLRW